MNNHLDVAKQLIKQSEQKLNKGAYHNTKLTMIVKNQSIGLFKK